MESHEPAAGFEEIEHTADWALRVWAPNLPALFEQAARGMYHLMEVDLQSGPREQHSLVLQADEPEVLLVGFLSELLYVLERDELVFDYVLVELEGEILTARLEGALCTYQRKEIKAVTYHALNIVVTPAGLEVVIVFDV